VVRGGAWNNDQDNTRAAYRNRNHPNNRNDNLGFRVCLSTSSGSSFARGTDHQWPELRAGYALLAEAENGGA